MAACPQCGEENDDRSRFCSSCGTPLAVPTVPVPEARKTVTVLFADVVGSTRLGEMQDPERLRRVMSRYFDEMRTVLERHGGAVEKFIGDAVMAVFGTPRVREDDALRALRAAAEMRDALRRLNENLESSLGVQLQARIGVNTGEVVTGDPSGGQAFVTGDTVNAAERLQRAASEGEILLGESTYRLARQSLRAEPVGPLHVKGKEAAVPAYRLLEIDTRPAAPPRRFDSPMIGRAREHELLTEAFERAVDERACHLVTVLGPAGVGKSRLIAEVLSDISPRASVLVGSCLPYGEGITFWPVIEVVKQAIEVRDDEPADSVRARIAERLAGDEDALLVAERVAGLMGLGNGVGATEESFWGIRKLLESLAKERPLVVVFDDVNWAEPTFLDLVQYIADWSRDAPILLVCMARPDLLEARPTWTRDDERRVSLVLEPLTDEESERLIGNLVGSAALAPDARTRILEAAEGNPLFVEEMLAMLIDEGILVQEDGVWTAAQDLSHVQIPSTITVLLASRLDRLDPEERQVLDRAAVEGNVFHWTAVQELSAPVASGRISASLMALVRKDLIRPDRSSFAGDEAFRFRHMLIREVCYDAIPKQVRAELHERFAKWLERAAADRVVEYEELLGYHVEQAYRYRAELEGTDERGRLLARHAGERLASAGHRAFARGDVPAALNLLNRAVSLLDAAGATRPDVLHDLGVVVYESGDLAGADLILTRAIDAADTLGDARLGARALVERAALRQWIDPSLDVDDLLQTTNRAIPVLEESSDELGLSQAWRRVAQAYWWRCRFAEMEEVLARALAHAERAGDAHELSEVLIMFSRAAAMGPTPADEAIRRCREMHRRAEGDRYAQAWVDYMLAVLEAMQGAPEEARRLCARAKKTFQELGLTVTLAVADMYPGMVELISGDPVAVERELRPGYAALSEMGERGALSTIAAILARALYLQGRYDEAEGLTSVSREAASLDDVISQVKWRGELAKVLARRGEMDRAEALAREAVELASPTDFPLLKGHALDDLAEVLALDGRPEEAIAVLEEALRNYDAKRDVASAGAVRTRLEELAAARSA
jgi:class 3 adenylate cyclase/tetratricopeptide (TPR) repeat protein